MRVGHRIGRNTTVYASSGEAFGLAVAAFVLGLLGVSILPAGWVLLKLIDLGIPPGWWIIAIGIIITLLCLPRTSTKTFQAFLILWGISAIVSCGYICFFLFDWLAEITKDIQWF